MLNLTFAILSFVFLTDTRGRSATNSDMECETGIAVKKAGLLPVTTNAVPCGKGVVLTSGEICPGVRTPELLMLIPK